MILFLWQYHVSVLFMFLLVLCCLHISSGLFRLISAEKKTSPISPARNSGSLSKVFCKCASSTPFLPPGGGVSGWGDFPKLTSCSGCCKPPSPFLQGGAVECWEPGPQLCLSLSSSWRTNLRTMHLLPTLHKLAESSCFLSFIFSCRQAFSLYQLSWCSEWGESEVDFLSGAPRAWEFWMDASFTLLFKGEIVGWMDPSENPAVAVCGRVWHG